MPIILDPLICIAMYRTDLPTPKKLVFELLEVEHIAIVLVETHTDVSPSSSSPV